MFTGPYARGIGAYNSKFLLSDEYILGNGAVANCMLLTPVGPTGATQGLSLVTPGWRTYKPLPGTDAKVASIRFLALLCNALLQTGAPSNRLEEAMRPLISSGRIPPQMDAQNMACYLNLYDLQVSLCELSRWLRGGGSGNRHTSIIVANMVRSNV